MPTGSVTLETPYGEVSLPYTYNWETRNKLSVIIKESDFANFLENIRQPTLASIHFQISLEIEDDLGNTYNFNLPIPEEIMNKTPEELRAMQRERDQA